MKKTAIALVCFWLFVSGIAFGEGYILEFNANKTVIEGRIALEWDWAPNFITVGGSFISNEDNFTIYGADFSFGAHWLEQLQMSMGFKGVFGTEEHFPEDASLGAVAFMVSGNYDFGFGDYGFPLDIGISGRVCIAPEPLSFNDTEKYHEFEATLNFHMLQQKLGSLLIGYRYIGITFDKILNIPDETDSAAFIGYRLRF